MANSIVRLNGTTLITVDDTTATAADVAAGTYFYSAVGVKTLGTNKTSNPPYPFPDTDNGTVNYVVSNGNHVHFNIYTGQRSVMGLSIGTYQLSNATNTWANTVDNRPKLFSLYAGDKVELSATLTYNSGSRVNDWYFGLREANAASNVLVSESGDEAGKRTVSKIMTEDADVSTVFLYIGANGMGTNVEIDFEMNVIRSYIRDGFALPTLENNWDFKTSLTDTVGGLAATLGNSAVQDSNGVTISAANQFISIPLSATLGYGYEIDFGTTSKDFSSANGNLFMTSPANLSEGLVFHDSSSSWRGYYAATWDSLSPGTDPTALSEKTLRAIPIAYDGYNGSAYTHAVGWRFYVDGAPWYYPLINTGTTSLTPGSMTIGSGARSFYTMVVTGFRIYSNVDNWL